MTVLHVIRRAFRIGASEYRTIYTWKTWLSAWFVRVLAQVSFFALLGKLLGSPEQTRFLLIGNAVMLAAIGGMFAINMVSSERSIGTFALLAASPTHPAIVLAARGAYLIADGTVSATGALVVACRLFGIPLGWGQLLPVVVLIALVAWSAYGFGTLAGGLLLGFRSVETIATNVGLVTLMTLCGANVPLDAYPAPLRWVSEILPVTHGLAGVRLVFDGQFAAAAIQGAQEALVGAGWLVVCLLTFTRFVRRGRRLGTLDFAT
ncbi:ABC transporter permease [Amycolatopsis sp. GM8]|uniref:ABC transporter permease n=1 Tax=Amycolatopsis sp. GM8 TaxID=2896530 RepID=UPI001F282695|nr:ABC transporter permease [Amycolatopsis sp. GM8]